MDPQLVSLLQSQNVSAELRHVLLGAGVDCVATLRETDPQDLQELGVAALKAKALVKAAQHWKEEKEEKDREKEKQGPEDTPPPSSSQWVVEEHELDRTNSRGGGKFLPPPSSPPMRVQMGKQRSSSESSKDWTIFVEGVDDPLDQRFRYSEMEVLPPIPSEAPNVESNLRRWQQYKRLLYEHNERRPRVTQSQPSSPSESESPLSAAGNLGLRLNALGSGGSGSSPPSSSPRQSAGSPRLKGRRSPNSSPPSSPRSGSLLMRSPRGIKGSMSTGFLAPGNVRSNRSFSEAAVSDSSIQQLNLPPPPSSLCDCHGLLNDVCPARAQQKSPRDSLKDKVKTAKNTLSRAISKSGALPSYTAPPASPPPSSRSPRGSVIASTIDEE